MGNIVAIVGRPNVGKSTLFNRLIEQRKSIMDNQSGVTRDRLYGQAEWTGKFFTVIDTGGYVVGSEDTFEQAIREQVRIAIEEADVVLFMVDVITGLTELDKDFANVVRQYDKPVFLVANKADDHDKALNSVEFYELALGEDIYTVSSQTGSGTGDLLDKVVEALPNPETEESTNEIPKIAVMGRPNVGKSSFVNALIGEERNIVTDIAGTTRDSLNTHYKYFGKNFILIDTAGIRKKSRVKENIEFYSVMRSLRALESADVCIVLLDAERGIEAQDVNIISLAVRNGKGVVIMVNKWDLIEKATDTAKKYTETIHEKIAPMNFIPVVYSSVLTKQRIYKAISTAIEVYESRQNKIPTSQLNNLILPEIERYPPPAVRGRYINIKYMTQLKTHKPSFAFFCNYPQHVKEPYKRFLENQIRKHFGFEGVPINIFMRKK